jgi:hypothetical protein
MKRKIIITESQYNKLQEFLFETADINHTLDFVKVGDILKFKSPSNNPYDIKIAHVDHANNEILGYFNGDSVRLSFDAYNEQTKKFNFQILDKKTKKYINKEDDISRELDIIRNGKVLQIPDVGGNKQPEATPAPAPAPVGKPDEISPEVELDPNVVIPNKEEDFDEMIDNIEQEYESDDIFRQALYTQPSFLERLKGEITGKKPQGSGIIIANKLVNSYKDKGSNDFLNADFQRTFFAKFKPLEKYKLEYEVDGKINYIEFDEEREAKVGNTNDRNQRKLEYENKKNEKFEILVTKNISTEKTPNYFLCYVSTYSTEKGNKIKNKSVPVKLQFIDSTGFKIKNK